MAQGLYESDREDTFRILERGDVCFLLQDKFGGVDTVCFMGLCRIFDFGGIRCMAARRGSMRSADNLRIHSRKSRRINGYRLMRTKRKNICSAWRSKKRGMRTGSCGKAFGVRYDSGIHPAEAAGISRNSPCGSFKGHDFQTGRFIPFQADLPSGGTSAHGNGS